MIAMVFRNPKSIQ